MTDSKEIPLLDAEPVENPDAGMSMVPADSGQIAHLMEMAVQGGAESVGTLERLVELQHKVEDRNARKAYVAALNAFREECPQPTKNRENRQFKVTRDGVQVFSKYADLAEIERVARPVAARHGLTWTWDTTVSDDLMHVTCKVQHIDGHSDSSTVSMPHESKAGSSPQQKYGSTQTYGMRYSLIAALGITTSDDDVDGAAAGDTERITDGQADFLKGLLKDGDANVAKFLEIYGISSIEEMALKDFGRAVKDIEERNAAKKAANEDS
jgi:hypothetical protein